MSDINSVVSPSTANFLKQKSDIANDASSDGKDFSDVLKDSIKEVNKLQKDSEKAMEDLATGKVKDLHQAAISINKAETHMKLTLEIRNKALNAYKEILRTQM